MLSYPQGITSIDQVAVVVPSLDQAMEQYWTKFGIGPWSVYTFKPDWIRDMTIRGRRQDYTMRLAITQVGPTMYELIEPVEGPTLYEEFLAQHGGGLHHLGYFVQDLDKAIEAMEAQGYATVQSGRGFGVDGDGGYAYFDTVSAVGCILEAIAMPAKMPEPESTYPTASR
jgi:methylmalonyl-CoA/ethylmalonyl-CoA epimerase